MQSLHVYSTKDLKKTQEYDRQEKHNNLISMNTNGFFEMKAETSLEGGRIRSILIVEHHPLPSFNNVAARIYGL